MKAVEVLVQECCKTVELLEGYRKVAGQEGYKKALGRQGGCKKVEVMVAEVINKWSRWRWRSSRRYRG